MLSRPCALKNIKSCPTPLAFVLVILTLALAGCVAGGGSGGSSSSGSGSGSESGSGGDASALLSWVAPASREDGSPMNLSDIEKYEIHYGTSSGNYTNSVTVNDPHVTERTVNGLHPGTYYFAMRVYDTDGLASRFSEEYKATVN